MMYVWNQRMVISLLVVFGVLQLFWWVAADGGSSDGFSVRAAYWLVGNYVTLVVWVFVWMFDQTRVRGRNAWVWLLPLLVAPLPTLVAFVLVMQKRRT